jgi:hypothetical protein
MTEPTIGPLTGEDIWRADGQRKGLGAKHWDRIAENLNALIRPLLAAAEQRGYDECNSHHASTHDSIEESFAHEKAQAVAAAQEEMRERCASHAPYLQWDREGELYDVHCECGLILTTSFDGSNVDYEWATEWREHIRALPISGAPREEKSHD